MPHSTLAAPLNYRTVSGPGSPARQPRWGAGSDRMLHSTADSLEEVMTEQDLIKAVNYVCMTMANLTLTKAVRLSVASGRYHHPSAAAAPGTPARSRVWS
jgi:hypothetical protein